MMNPKIAVLGCGYWGKNLVRNFHALALWHWCATRPSRAWKTAQQIAPKSRCRHLSRRRWATRISRRWPSPRRPLLHYPLAKAALLAGKDVYVEKPLCLQVGQAEELVRLADQRGKVLMVGHLLQYHPCVDALHSLLARGELGKLHYITSNRLNLGKIRREENSLWSFAPHDISVILSLARRTIARAGPLHRRRLPEPRRGGHNPDRHAFRRRGPRACLRQLAQSVQGTEAHRGRLLRHRGLRRHQTVG